MTNPNETADRLFPNEAIALTDLLSHLETAFAAAGIETARLDARLLVQHALNMDHGEVILHKDRLVQGAELSRLEGLARRRLQREPVSRLMGLREFWSLPFSINAATLDPRPDTETLVEAALAYARRAEPAPLRILDLGTGSGCILLSLLFELSGAHGVGIDKDPDAVAVATRNAQQLGLHERASFMVSDWFEKVTSAFQLIVANPPYIAKAEEGTLEPEVRHYDPHDALFSGATGLEAYAQILQEVERYMAPKACLIFECGAGQDQDLIRLLEASSLSERLTNISLKADLAGINRVVVAEL